MLNDCVQRIAFSNGRIDIPIQSLRVETGDRLNISCDEQKSAECIMHGMCFEIKNGRSYISCGGLECVLPTFVALHHYTDISISKLVEMTG